MAFPTAREILDTDLAASRARHKSRQKASEVLMEKECALALQNFHVFERLEKERNQKFLKEHM